MLDEMKKDKQASPIARYGLWIFYGLLAYMPFHIFLSTWVPTCIAQIQKLADFVCKTTTYCFIR